MHFDFTGVLPKMLIRNFKAQIIIFSGPVINITLYDSVYHNRVGYKSSIFKTYILNTTLSFLDFFFSIISPPFFFQWRVHAFFINLCVTKDLKLSSLKKCWMKSMSKQTRKPHESKFRCYSFCFELTSMKSIQSQ